MTSEDFLQTKMFRQLTEHAWTENDVTLHNLLQSLRAQPDRWTSAEAFLSDALLLMSTQQAGLRQQLVDQAERQAPRYVLCTHCNPYAWK